MKNYYYIFWTEFNYNFLFRWKLIVEDDWFSEKKLFPFSLAKTKTCNQDRKRKRFSSSKKYLIWSKLVSSFTCCKSHKMELFVCYPLFEMKTRGKNLLWLSFIALLSISHIKFVQETLRQIFISYINIFILFFMFTSKYCKSKSWTTLQSK